MPTSICKHSLGVRAGVAERVRLFLSSAGDTGQGVKGTGQVLLKSQLLVGELS